MNKYESVILLNSSITEENRERLVSKFTNFLNLNGKVTKIDELGVKKLAYEVRKQRDAYYIVLEFKTESNNIAELERLYRITDEVLKFIVIRIDD